MKRIAVSVFAMGVLAAVATAAQMNRAVVSRELKGQYVKLTKAYQNKDVNSIVALCVESCKFKGNGRTVTIKDAAKEMREQMDKVEVVKALSQFVALLWWEGDTAVVSASDSMTVKVKNPKTNKMSTVLQKTWSKDTWVKKPDGWKLLEVQETKREVYVDGKKVG